MTILIRTRHLALVLIALLFIISFASAAEVTWVAGTGCWTATDGTYSYVKWNTTGTDFNFTVPLGVTSIEYLNIAGGGGGGYSRGAGGGAGGYKTASLAVVAGQGCLVRVGAGANGGTVALTRGGFGSNSTFCSVVSDGGGPGGSASINPGFPGGSGGGSVDGAAAGTTTGGSQGNNGGIGSASAPSYGAGGGGGKGNTGSAGSASNGGNGGSGASSSITGIAVCRAGGGGGGSLGGTAGTATCGGGAGSNNGDPGVSGTDETGGGGGGGGYSTGPGNGGAGGSGVVIIKYEAPATPSADFTWTPTYPLIDQTVQFTDTSTDALIETWNWSFGDVDNSTLQNPKHYYAHNNTFAVNLTVTNKSYQSTKIQNIQVWNATDSNFSANVTSGFSPLPVGFTNTETNLSTSWYWDFGDGNVSTSINGNHTYEIPGVYNVSHRVLNPATSSWTNKTSYIAVYAPITTDFVGTPTDIYSGDTVTFTDLSSGTVTTWLWDFGDGTHSGLQNPTHVYTGAGMNYTVNLSASSPIGTKNESKVDYIRVYNSSYPKADFTGTPTTGSPSLLVTFTSQSTGLAPLTYNWSFGDGTFSDVQNPQHVYTYSGTYDVNLTVTNSIATVFERKNMYIVVASSLQQQNTWYTPHQVRVAVNDRYGNKLPGMTVDAIANSDSFPTDSTSEWLTALYGIQPDVANDMLNGTLIMQSTTGDDGSSTFTMHSSIKYDIGISNATTGVVQNVSFYPIDSLYTVWMQGNTVNNSYMQMGYNQSLYVTEPNTSYVTMNLNYTDMSGLTNNLIFTVVAKENNTVINTQSFSGFGTNPIYANYTVPNVRGKGYYWQYDARRTV